MDRHRQDRRAGNFQGDLDHGAIFFRVWHFICTYH